MKKEIAEDFEKEANNLGLSDWAGYFSAILFYVISNLTEVCSSSKSLPR